MRLIASTLDGRQAERRIARSASLVPIALGLISSVPPEREASPPETPPEEVPPSAAELPPPEPVVSRAPVPLPPPRVQVEIGVAAGVRMGFPTRVAMADLEARAAVVAGGWLVVASARFAPFGVRAGISGYSYDEVALGLGFGRRVDLGAAALDVTFSPELVVMTEEGDAPADGVGGTESEARLDVAGLLRLPWGTGWKPTLALDAELAPLSHALRADPALPALPTWTLGLRVGAAGNLL